MNAEQFISIADALRAHALRSGNDMNASNLFVHTMLMRAISVESEGGDGEIPLDYARVSAVIPRDGAHPAP